MSEARGMHRLVVRMNVQLDKDRTSRFLLRSGVLLFLLGLLTGFVVPMLASPRLALSSHLEGLMNGMFLVLVGLMWPRLELARWTSIATLALMLFGTYVNWGTTLLAALWAAGQPLMPIAASGQQGTAAQELVIKIGLVSLSLAMVAGTALLLWGLRGAADTVVRTTARQIGMGAHGRSDSQVR